MADATFRAAVLIEDNPNLKYTSTLKTYAPMAYGSKTYIPFQIKMPIYTKETLAIYLAFKEFGRILWVTTKSVIILTEKKPVIRVFKQE